MNKHTTWDEIKDRVEIKIGEDIDSRDFVTLANEAISDINEISYIDAPPKRYVGSKIKKENDSYTIELKDIFKDPLLNEVQITLPFEYNYNYGEIEFELLDWDGEKDKSKFWLEEKKMNGHTRNLFTNILIVHTDSSNIAILDGKMKISKKTLRLRGEGYGFNEEMYVEVPEEMSSIIKIEVRDATGKLTTVTQTSISSFTEDVYGFGTRYERNLYYIHDGLIHLFSSYNNVTEIIVYFARRMRKVDKNIDLGTQWVELETNFENILTFSIAHKWLENYEGTESSETNAMYNKYIALKKEYEKTNLPKRVNRKQKEILVVA